MEDKTLALLTPDVVADGRSAAIEGLIAANNFAILARIETTLTPEQAAELYEEHEGKPFFAALCSFMSSGPLIALALSKANAVECWKQLLGPESVLEAKEEAPGSIRAVYGTDNIKKAAHGSLSASAAYRELKFFFPKVYPRESTLTLVSDSKVLDAAAADGFLVIATKQVTLSLEQATAFASSDVFADASAKAAAIADQPLTAALLEKPFAVETWLAHPASSQAAHSSLSPTAATAEATRIFGTNAITSIQTTFAFVKPNAFADAPAILAHAEAAGFSVLCSKEVTLTQEQVDSFYAEHKEKAFFPNLSAFMTSGPSLAMVLQRPCAIAAWRSLIGPTNSETAKANFPLSIRALYGLDGTKNAVHGSDSPVSVARESGFFFPELSKTQSTLAIVWPDATDKVDDIVKLAAAAGLVVTNSISTQLDSARATDLLALLGSDLPRAPPPPPPQPFISAFVEAGDDSAVQIYNPTDNAIDLKGYALGWLSAKSKNAGAPSDVISCEPGKLLPAKSVFCFYAHGASDSFRAKLPADPAQSQAIEGTGISKGEDGMALMREGQVLDLIGDFTQTNRRQPWDVAGVKKATKRHTLVRKGSTRSGSTRNWTDPIYSTQGTSAETSGWVVLPLGTLSMNGWDLSTFTETAAAPPRAPCGTLEAKVQLLTSAPLCALALTGKAAVATWGAMLGPDDPLAAKVRCPGCLRAKFGTDATRNVGHGSATAAAALSELKFFFPKTLVDPLPDSEEAHAYVAKEIVPTLTDALVELCNVKPNNPVGWLAHWLMANNPNKPKVPPE